MKTNSTAVHISSLSADFPYCILVCRRVAETAGNEYLPGMLLKHEYARFKSGDRQTQFCTAIFMDNTCIADLYRVSMFNVDYNTALWICIIAAVFTSVSYIVPYLQLDIVNCHQTLLTLNDESTTATRSKAFRCDSGQCMRHKNGFQVSRVVGISATQRCWSTTRWLHRRTLAWLGLQLATSSRV